MTRLETTIKNIESIIKTIKENNLTSYKQISEFIDINPSQTSHIIRDYINAYDNIIYKEEGFFKTKCEKITDIKFIVKMICMIKFLHDNPDIILYQNKHLIEIYGLNWKEVHQFRAYATDYIKIWEDLDEVEKEKEDG